MLLCYVFFEISDRNSGNELGTQWVPGVNCRAGKERVSGAFGIFWCSLSGTGCLVLFREAGCFSGPMRVCESESVPEWEGGREREDKNRKPEKREIRIRGPDMKKEGAPLPLWVSSSGFPEALILLRDSQGLARVNLVRILQHGLVGLEDGGVSGTVALAILAFGDLPEGVSLLNGVEH